MAVTTALVPYPPVFPTFAFHFDCTDRSIVFSGDTAHSDSLIELAHGAGVLVHEVMNLGAIGQTVHDTPTASRLRKHLEHSHAPMEKVGKIGTAAGVKTLMLNRFVPRRLAQPDHV